MNETTAGVVLDGVRHHFAVGLDALTPDQWEQHKARTVCDDCADLVDYSALLNEEQLAATG